MSATYILNYKCGCARISFSYRLCRRAVFVFFRGKFWECAYTRPSQVQVSLLRCWTCNRRGMWAWGSHGQIAVGQEVREIWRSWSWAEGMELGLFAWQWEIPSGSLSKSRPSVLHSSKSYIKLLLVSCMQGALHWKQIQSSIFTFLRFFYMD